MFDSSETIGTRAADGAPSIESELRFARVDAALGWTSIVVMANLATSGLLTAYFGGLRGEPTAAGWFGAIALLAVLRIWLNWRYRRDSEKARHVVIWERVLLVGSLLSGLIWGVGAIVLLPADPASQWLWSLTVAGMCSGAVALHAAHPRSATCYILPACIPLMGRVSFGGGVEGWLSSGLILTFILLTVLNAHKVGSEFGRIFSLQLAMERKSAELDEANRRLSREIAENQRKAAELDQSRKMEAVGRLTAGVAHDFNNLFTVILAKLEMIARRSDREDVRRMAGTAIDAIESGAQLTASMLAFSRKQVLKPQPVDLNALIERTMAMLTGTVGTAVTVRFDRLSGVFQAQVDAAHLQTALLNLTCNARDAMDGRGEIRLTLDEQTVAQDARLPTGSQLAAGRYVVITVADDGPGIAAEILDKIFEPFFTTKPVGRGTGLGLAQVFGFVTQSGGAVDVVSELGVGTQFRLFLPYSDAALPENRLVRASDDPNPSDAESDHGSNSGRVRTRENGGRNQ